jgi:hypothetical protein
MSLAELARFIAAEPDFDTRWRLVVEFLKEYHRESEGTRDGADAPAWSASRGLRRFWFPFDTPGARRRWCMPGRVAQAGRVRLRLRDRRRVSDPSPLLDRAGIEEAFRRLGDRLARRGVAADLYVFGGAAMPLAYDSLFSLARASLGYEGAGG